MRTQEIIRESLREVSIQDYEHKRQVGEIVGHMPATLAIQPKIEQLKERGFEYFVSDNLFQKFKYTAGIQGSYTVKRSNAIWSLAYIFVILSLFSLLAYIHKDSWYLKAGVILLFFPGLLIFIFAAGAEIQSVDYVGDIPQFVIENMRRLPEGTDYRYTIHSNEPLPVVITKLFSKVEPVMIAWLDSGMTIGVVVGVWDNDKELEI